MNTRLIFLIFAALVFPLATATACGPDFSADIFIYPSTPDNPSEFAAGKLGILLPTFPRTDLIAAYRYLNGGRLTDDERKAYQPTCSYQDQDCWRQWGEQFTRKQANSPFEQWKAAHAKYGKMAPKIQPEKSTERGIPNGYYKWSYLNCTDGAFHTAALTIEERAGAWGKESLELADWLKAQDAVFANCGGGGLVLPTSAPESSPALLKADRKYQIAAAYFYAGDFNKAREQFAAIQSDPSSPWRGIAGYLAARCLVRQAFLTAPGSEDDTEASFDSRLLKQAANALEELLKETGPNIPKQAIQDELDLVRIRLEPMARVGELSLALAGPKPDVGFDQHLRDLTWFINSHVDGLAIRPDVDLPEQRVPELTPGEKQRAEAFNNAFDDVEDIRSAAPLTDWLLTFQSPSENAKDHAIEQWRKTPSLAWLVAAISKATAEDDEASDLVAAAAKETRESPSWEMLTFHRARLLLALGKTSSARSLLDNALPEIAKSGRGSSVNAFLALKMRAAVNFDEFLSFAPRKVLLRMSEESSSDDECLSVMHDPARKYDCVKDIEPEQFSSDAAAFFNTQAPLSLLLVVARSERIPIQLRRSMAMMAWTRSVLLKDDESANELLPLLPAKLQVQAGKGSGFRAVVTLVRNPGLRPYLDSGVQRNYSYDFVESFRDNWWCEGWQTVYEHAPQSHGEQFTFLTAQQKKEAQQQTHQLTEQGDAKLHLGQLVVAYATANPDDPDVPEALYLVLRMNRYSCDSRPYTPAGKEQENKADVIAREAARLLRRRYLTSLWTEKARPLVP